MNKRIIVLVMALIMCLALVAAGFAACKDDPTPTTYTVTYVYGNGEENLTRTVKEGDKAIEPKNPEREDYKFDYWYSTDANTPYDFDTAVIADLTLTAHWTAEQKPVPPVKNTYINWNSGNYAEILIDGQSGIQLNVVPEGEEIYFKLHVSPYSCGTAIVKADDNQITADADGWYVVVAQGSQMLITVTGLENDNTPITGVGSLRDPYILSTPSNFKTFADAVNNPNNDKYNSAYVALAADLSFNGEEIDPIGLVLNESHFEGHFDGRGHTISDFVMKGKEGMGGLFAYVVTGEVKNVNVKDVVYNIDTTETSNYIVGGIVAYNMGSDISGCSFKGDIQVNLNANTTSYVGGIVGFGQGYSDTNSATVSYSSADVNFISNGISSLLAVGGIAGGIVGTADSAPMLIYNSVFNGSISGKVILAGGIVGYLREDASIANCYADGSIAAANTAGYAAAGAFVGLAEQNTAITNSYSTATYTAIHASSVGDVMEGTIKGDFAGNYYPDGDKAEGTSVDAKEIFVYNSYILSEGQIIAKGKYDAEPTADTTDFSAVKTLLKWNDSEWSFVEGKPTVAVNANGEYGINFNLTFDFDGKTVVIGGETINSADEGNIDSYLPLDWVYQGNGQNTFKAEDNAISYGFFLDSARTIRLPSAMLLTSDITVYVGFADYSSVAAEYFITDANGDEASITFDDNGMMTMYYNGMIARYVYVYDGEKILIKDAYFAYMFYTSTDGSSLIADFYAEKVGNTLAIYDNLFFVEGKDDGELIAYSNNAVKGDWYDVDQSIYTFYLDGTGKIVTATTRESDFDYIIDQNNITITIGGVSYDATLSADGRKITTSQGETLSLDKFDLFAGEWETSFNNPVRVSFDGMGEMTFEDTTSAYTVDADGVITFSQGTAIINADGLIEMSYNGANYTFARAHSYRGTWYDSGYDYMAVLEGVGVNGYGYGYDSQGIEFTYSLEKTDITDSTDGYRINLFYRTIFYGYANYAKNDDGSEMLLYAVSNQNGAIYDNYMLAYFDPLLGEWSSSDGLTFDFNGLGAYDIDMPADNMQWTVQGTVTITEGSEQQTVRYTYIRSTATATFTYKEVLYTVNVDKQGNVSFSTDSVSGQPLYGDDIYADTILGGDGYVISFNGKSASGRGVATVIKDGVSQTYEYTLNGKDITLLQDKVAVGSIVLNEQIGYMVMSLNSVSDVLLGLHTDMNGKTYIAVNGFAIIIGEFDIEGIATGTVLDAEATFIYQSQKQIAVYIDGSLTYYLVYQNEYNIAVYSASANLELLSMFVVPDGMGGVYTAADGSSFEFDGRSLVFGYYAAVTYTKDGVDSYYYYEFNEEDGTYTVFALDRTGEYDEQIALYTVYTSEQQGAVAYTAEDGATLWIIAVE